MVHSYFLPSHLVVGHDGKPRHVAVQVALPAWEEFTPPDAFAGKEFVRFITGLPVRLDEGFQPYRLRSKLPTHDTLWLPDRCISYHNTLELAREQRCAKSKSGRP